MEADLVKRTGISFTAIPAGQVHGVGLRALIGIFQLARGLFAARKIIRVFKPDALLLTGGFVAVPAALAGRRLPTLVCVPDIEPGLALRLVSRLADHIAVPVEDSKAYFPTVKNIHVTGYPTRPDLTAWEPAQAYREFGLSPDKPTLLVTGGSRGARSINQAVTNALPDLLDDMQIIHITGTLTWQEEEAKRQTLPPRLAASYRAFDYLHEQMGAALTIADLVVTRAGASILGDLPAFSLPAVLVPYPHAWRYQKVNADYLAQQSAAVVLKDEDLGDELSATIQDLMHNKFKLSQMKSAMQSLARPEAASIIAGILKQAASPQAGAQG